MLTGLPVAELGIERSAAIFRGIGAHVGRARSRSAAGHILGHVRDMGADPDDPKLHLTMRLAPGDMQFMHNHDQLHDRTGFKDWPEPERRRHPLRLWLTVDGDRPLPEVFRRRYGSVEIGNRGGIVTRETRPHTPPKPG